jgi:hypothetical protein
MKSMLTIILLVLLSGITVYSQNSYEVEPGTKNNRLTLDLVNLSSDIPIHKVTIEQVGSSDRILFASSKKIIDTVTSNSGKTVSFTFDVAYNIATAEADTIEFLIYDGQSIYQSRQFILRYSHPNSYALEQNYPNPFNPTTKIRYRLPKNDAGLTRVQLVIYDILGAEVKRPVEKMQEAGYYEVEFNAAGLASGMYIYRLQTEDFSAIKKMLLLK